MQQPTLVQLWKRDFLNPNQIQGGPAELSPKNIGLKHDFQKLESHNYDKT